MFTSLTFFALEYSPISGPFDEIYTHNFIRYPVGVHSEIPISGYCVNFKPEKYNFTTS